MAIVAAVFVASRLVFWLLGVRFDTEPLTFYWQYVDPALLRHDLWRSIFYLEQQPPLFNLFLGGILHLAPRHPEIAFHLVYLCLGLALSLSLFVLMDRLNVDRRIALAITLFFTLSPSTVLYENLLFYEYPLAALLCVAALFLHRYATAGRMFDGVVFFSVLALLSGIRTFYHLVWFAMITLFTVSALRHWRRRTILAAVVPGLLLVSFYAKHVVMFHNLAPGARVNDGLNLSVMTAGPISDEALNLLIASGKISPILQTDLFRFVKDETDVEHSSLATIVPVPPKVGIPVLDNCRKSTEGINWNCRWAEEVTKLYAKDSLVVLRTYPKAYLQSVGTNFAHYFTPDTHRWPFDGREDDPNQQILSRPLAVYNLVTAGEWPLAGNPPWISYLALPVLFGFGVLRVIRGTRQMFHDPAITTLALMVFNISFVTTVVVLFSEADQNRYRSELAPYFAVLLGCFLTSMMSGIGRKTKSSELAAHAISR